MGIELPIDALGVIVSCPSCGQKNRLRFETLGQEIRCGKCKTALPFPNAPLGVHSSEHFRAVTTNSRLPVLVDFWAPWCGPCKMLAPELEKVAASSDAAFVVAKVNTDELQDIAAQFRISSIPTLAVMHRGRELTRQAGAAPAAAINAFVRQVIG